MHAAITPSTPASTVAHLSVIAAAVERITEHATIQMAIFSQLVRSKLNIRRDASDVAELMCLIRNQGLLQNLVGYRQLVDGIATGVIEIVAGGRRLLAIGQLIEAGDLPRDFSIPVLLVTEDEAIEISLTENLGRLDMHPADVFEAMQQMIDRGRAIEDVALRFNIDVLTVKRRLKLANIAPRLLDLYRSGVANFDHMMALALTDDHAAQLQAWDSLGTYHRTPYDLRRLLTAQQINIRTDRLARYVGAEAVEKAGGVVLRDLFSDNGDGYIGDAVLLERLAMAKLEKQRAKLLKDGVAWVDLLPRADYAALSAYGKVRIGLSAVSDQQQQWLAALDERMQLLDQRIDAAADDGDEDADARLTAERDELEQQRRAILATRVPQPNPDDQALAGAVLVIDDGGALAIKRDLIRPADKAKMRAEPDGLGGAGRSKRVKPVHSDRLTLDLTSHRTAALQAELMDQGELALTYLTYTLMKSVLLDHGAYERSTLARIGLTRPTLAEVARKGSAAAAFEQRRQLLLERLPAGGQGDSWLEWLRGQPQEVVLELLAFCVAASLDATQGREGDAPAFVTLAQAAKLDMSKWWKATAGDYFAHVSKGRMIQVVTEAVSPQAAVALEKMKKGAAADAAERVVADAGWLPQPLRSA